MFSLGMVNYRDCKPRQSVLKREFLYKNNDDARQAIIKIHPLKIPESSFARWQRDANSVTTRRSIQLNEK